MMMRRLRAGFAVFRTAPAASIDNGSEVNFLSDKGRPNPVSPLAEIFQIAGEEKGEVILTRDSPSVYDFLCQSAYIHFVILLRHLCQIGFAQLSAYLHAEEHGHCDLAEVTNDKRKYTDAQRVGNRAVHQIDEPRGAKCVAERC